MKVAIAGRLSKLLLIESDIYRCVNRYAKQFLVIFFRS